MPDVAPAPLWVRLGHRTIVAYGTLCLLAGFMMLFRAAGSWALWAALLFVMTPPVVLAWLAGPLALGLGHWLGDLVTKREAGHTVARMLSRNAQSVHGTAIVLGTCGYYPLTLSRQIEPLVLPVLLLVMVLFAIALSASAHTARHCGRPLTAASFSASIYAGIGVMIGVASGAMWLGAFALPFAAYFAATATWLIRAPQWSDA